MEVTFKKAFSIVDGRLATEMGGVYEMLNFIFDQNLHTHQLPTAFRKIREVSPAWYQQGTRLLAKIKAEYGTDDFNILMRVIDRDYPKYTLELTKIDYKIELLAGLDQIGKK